MIPIIVYSIIFLCLFIATFRFPSVALAALLCMYGIKQWAQSVHPFFVTYSTLTNYLVAMLMLLALVVNFIRNKPIFKNYPLVGWMIIALFSYSYISIQWVSVPEISHDLWVKQSPYIFTVLLMSPLLLSSSKSLSESFMVLLPLGTVIIALLLFNANWVHREVELIAPDGHKMMGNPLAVAEMAGYVMFAAALMNFEGKLKFFWQIFRWVIIAGCLALAVKSGSRGQFLVMLVMCIVFLPMSRRISNPYQFALLICGVVIIGVLGSWAFDCFSVTGDARWNSMKMEHDVYGRYCSAMKLLDSWYSSPSTIVFGLGNSASYDPNIIGFYPHVVLLEILAEEGLIGILFFTSIVVLSIISFIRSFVAIRGDIIKRGLLSVVGSASCFLFILSFKQGSMLGSTLLFAFSIYIGKYELILKNEG